MENLDKLQILLEILVLILTLSVESPILGMVSVIAVLVCLLIQADERNN